MFVIAPPGGTSTPLIRDDARSSLALLAERTRPTAASETRLLPVLPPLAGLLPDGSLRRGSTIVVAGSVAAGTAAAVGTDGTTTGVITLALALLAGASRTGLWCAVIGLPDLGAVAAHDLGIDLDRSALIPRPGPAWAEAAAAMIDGTDLVVLRPPFPPRPAMVRRLVARTRERRSVLIVVPGRAGWPECPDVRLTVTSLQWDGIGSGEGYLRRRRMTVTATGRRSAARARERHLWLPSSTGTAERAGPVDRAERAER